jgi:hypothetical protein
VGHERVVPLGLGIVMTIPFPGRSGTATDTSGFEVNPDEGSCWKAGAGGFLDENSSGSGVGAKSTPVITDKIKQ